MGIFGAISGAVAGSGGSANGQSQFDMAGWMAQGGKPFDIKGMKAYSQQQQQPSVGAVGAAGTAAAATRAIRGNSNNNSGGLGGFGANVSVGSQPQANDHTHEDNNNTQPSLQGPATAVTSNPQAGIMSGASNVASQNQMGAQVFGSQSLPEKGAIGVAGMDQMDQF